MAWEGIITQNVDGLHQAAGSRDVIDLHGRLSEVLCLGCQKIYQRDQVQHWLSALNPDAADWDLAAGQAELAPDGDAEVAATAGFRVADCPACGGLLKPHVVFFGEIGRAHV